MIDIAVNLKKKPAYLLCIKVFSIQYSLGQVVYGTFINVGLCRPYIPYASLDRFLCRLYLWTILSHGHSSIFIFRNSRLFTFFFGRLYIFSCSI